jgi:hypothetical protein
MFAERLDDRSPGEVSAGFSRDKNFITHQTEADADGEFFGLIEAHGGADVLVAEEFLDFPQILSHVVEQNRCRECRNPWAVISPTPSALQAARSRRLNARLENGAPE